MVRYRRRSLSRILRQAYEPLDHEQESRVRLIEENTIHGDEETSYV